MTEDQKVYGPLGEAMKKLIEPDYMCLCGHPKSQHDELTTNHACRLSGCGCVLFRIAPAAVSRPEEFFESTKESIYDELVRHRNLAEVLKQRLAAADMRAKEVEQLHVQQLKDDEENYRSRLVASNVALAQQERKVVIYNSLINLLADGGRFNTELLDCLEAGLTVIERRSSPTKLVFYTSAASMEAMTDGIDLTGFTADFKVHTGGDGVVEAHICESEDCDDSYHDHEVGLTNLKVQPHTEAYNESMAAYEEDGPTGVGGYIKPIVGYGSSPGEALRDAFMKRPVKDNPQA